jgi:hypothetical protein
MKERLYDKCDKVERLNPHNFDHMIKEALNWSINQNWTAISLDKLESEKPESYSKVTISAIVKNGSVDSDMRPQTSSFKLWISFGISCC